MSESDHLQTGVDDFNNGDYPAAVKAPEAALTGLRHADKPTDLGLCIYYLEGARAVSESRELHNEPIEEALALFQQTGLHYLAASCCKSLAENVVTERPAKAKRLLEQARMHYTQCDNSTGAASVSRLEAKFSVDRGDTREALRLLEDATKLIDEQPLGLESVRAEKRAIEKLRASI